MKESLQHDNVSFNTLKWFFLCPRMIFVTSSHSTSKSIGSRYVGIFAYVLCLILMVNAGKYTIHGSRWKEFAMDLRMLFCAKVNFLMVMADLFLMQTQLQFTFPVPCMKYRVLYCLYYKNGYGLWNPNKLTRMSFEMFVWNVCVCVMFSLHFQRWIDIHCEVKGSQIGFRSIDSADQCSRSILLVDKLWRLERLDTHLTWWNTNHTNHIGQIDAFDEKFIDCVFHWLFQNVVYQDRDCIYVHWITLIYHMLGVAKTPCNIR